MQSLSRFISGGSLKGKKDAKDGSVATSPPSNTGYLGPPLTAAESRKLLENANPNPTFGRPEVKLSERRGSWHEGGEFLGV